jgi:hypothetical protein
MTWTSTRTSLRVCDKNSDENSEEAAEDEEDEENEENAPNPEERYVCFSITCHSANKVVSYRTYDSGTHFKTTE